RHRAAEQLADLSQVRADPLLLLVEVVDLALSDAADALGLALGVGQQLVSLRLGLGEDRVGVLLGVSDELLRVLICLAPGLLGLHAGLPGPLLGDRRPLLGLGPHLLSGLLRLGEPLGLLPLSFLPAGGNLHLEYSLGLRPRRLAVLECPLCLAAHLISLFL